MKSLRKLSSLPAKTALISLHPEHAKKILSGEKRLEFRRRWSSGPVDRIVIYATAPVKKIVGVVSVEDIHRGSPTALWELAKRLGGGLTRQALREYFSGQKAGVAIELGEITQFSPALKPTDIFRNFSAPQSYCYLSDEALTKIYDAIVAQRSLGNVIFVAGVHGVGKTTLCEKVEVLGVIHKSASSLIREERSSAISSNGKIVQDMRGNQELLVGAVSKIRATGKTLLLDGHFALLNENCQPQTIPVGVFSELGVKAIVLVHDTATTISQSLEGRDKQAPSKSTITELQSAEFSQATLVANELCVPMFKFQSSTEAQGFSMAVTRLCSGA